MSRSRGIAISLLALCVLLAPGCSKTVDVGAVISETGAAAVYGTKVKKGLDLALEEINKSGGFKGKPLQLIYKDDQNRTEVGETVTRELIEQDGVRMIIGAVSSPVTLKIAPLVTENDVVLLSPTASSPQVTAAGDHVFRVYPSDILEGTSMADFARDLRLERTVILAVDDDFGAGLRDVFTDKYQSKFRQVVKGYDFPEGDHSGFPDIVAEIKGIDPDAIYIVAYVDDWAEWLLQIRNAGIESIVLGTSAYTQQLVDIAGQAAEDMLFPQPAFDVESEDPVVRGFVLAYRERYGEDPDRFAAHGYDSLKVLMQAMIDGGSPHPSDVRIGLANISNFPGASGKITFDGNGDVVQYPRLFIIHDGAPVPYDEFIEEGGSLPLPNGS